MKKDIENSQAESFRFYECKGVDVAGTLAKIKRSSNFMSPIFEALSNSLDAVVELDEVSGRPTSFDSKEPITITFDFSSLAQEGASKHLDSVTIQDAGIGFTDDNYRRFLSLNDRSKGALNKGSGRVQFIKFFSSAEYRSVFRNANDESSETFYERRFTLSAEQLYLNHNAIVRETDVQVNDGKEGVGTTLVLRLPLNGGWTSHLEERTILDVKQKILSRFFLRLSDKRKTAPRIDIVFRINKQEEERETIEPSDVPVPHDSVNFNVHYKYLASDDPTKRFVKTDAVETFTVEGFVVKDDMLEQNSEVFVCRGEVVEDAKLGLVRAEEKFKGSRFVVAISGKYIDERVAETRESLGIRSDKEFRARPLFGIDTAEISIDDIRKAARDACAQIFPDLAYKKEEQAETLERLRENFGFTRSAVEAVRKKLPLNATKEEILKKLHKDKISKVARTDDAIDTILLSVRAINPKSKQHKEEVNNLVYRLLKLIPEQNKRELPHYFARRKIVLEQLGAALKGELDVQNEKGRKSEESILHDILFRRYSNDPSESDLWILNEEFVYFSGTSDVALKDIEFQGKKLLRSCDEFTGKNREFIEKRGKKRPDILLFPEEGKCILIELKSPKEDLSDHIQQINKYAHIIFNYAVPEFKPDRFYAYLIGGELDTDDIRGADSNFQTAEKFGYMFVTRKVATKFGGDDGEIYMEVHSYDTFYKRALARNKMFLDLLLKGVKSSGDAANPVTEESSVTEALR